ncbi:MAG: DUF1178 family protein [Deltaproteobacteria bacterium]|nr:MAG: DUF1178 family protein [Deltaproteobacteria bacterium]
MVIYDLICSQGHRFEGWFPGHKNFDEQKEMGLLECNVCGDHHVQKVLSGGHYVKSTGSAPARTLVKAPVHTTYPVNNGVAASGMLDSVTVLKAIKHYVTTHFENVGTEFPKKVKEMTNGQVPYQNIYGTATPEEQKQLAEEDIPHFLIPDLPPEFNN